MGFTGAKKSGNVANTGRAHRMGRKEAKKTNEMKPYYQNISLIERYGSLTFLEKLVEVLRKIKQFYLQEIIVK